MKAIRKAHGEEPSVNPALVAFSGTRKHPGIYSDHGEGRHAVTEPRIAVLMGDNSSNVVSLREQMHPPCLAVTH